MTPSPERRRRPPARPRRPFDPDFDPQPSIRVTRHDFDLGAHQRLVANPFLAVAAFVAWLIAVRAAITGQWCSPLVQDVVHPGFAPDRPGHQGSPLLVLSLVICLPAIAFLLQFHCRDCGATDLLFRWPHHACDRVLERGRLGRRRRLRGPNPKTQTILWVYMLCLIFLFYIVAIGFRW